MEVERSNKRPMIIMLIGVSILFLGIFGYKFYDGMRGMQQMQHQSQVVTVSTAKAVMTTWPSEVIAVGSLRTVLGVDITTELAGMIKTIYFKPGTMVKEGDVLVQLNADAENGQLESYKADAALAKITYTRNQAQYAVKAISKQTLDNNEYNFRSLEGKVIEQTATVAKKTLKAPFSGRLGISCLSFADHSSIAR